MGSRHEQRLPCAAHDKGTSGSAHSDDVLQSQSCLYFSLSIEVLCEDKQLSFFPIY